MRSSIVDDLNAAADVIIEALQGEQDWGLSGDREGQYQSDVAADAVAVTALLGAGYGVLSEESGVHQAGRDVMVVVDPLDGSTNAYRGIPWYAVSLCAVDAEGPMAAVVVDLPHNKRYSAERGGGSYFDGQRLRIGGPKPGVTKRNDAIVGLSGLPPTHLGWAQFRSLGAAALDLCAIATGTLDAFVDCSVDAHGVWDYLGGMLVCTEAGGFVADMHGRDLVVLDHAARRTPVAASSKELLDELVHAFLAAS